MITLQEISGYLPYKLKMKSRTFSRRNPDILELTMQNLPYLLHVNRLPILRPLSDLTKEIEVDGEVFIPLEKIFGANYSNWDKKTQSIPACVGHTYACSEGRVSPIHLPYWVVVNFYKLHFDIFGLIERGDAIDINSLK
jgi:hypothetical protein